MEISNARLEAAARAIMRAMGFDYTGGGRLIDDKESPRARQWVALAYAALTARPERKSKRLRADAP